MIPTPPVSGGASLAGKVPQTFIKDSPIPRPGAQTTGNAVKRIGNKGSTKPRGSGFESLPSIPGIQWEKKTDRPGFAVWFAPEGSHAHRNTKTYLGYAGKHLLTKWGALAETERASAIVAWVAERQKRAQSE